MKKLFNIGDVIEFRCCARYKMGSNKEPLFCLSLQPCLDGKLAEENFNFTCEGRVIGIGRLHCNSEEIISIEAWMKEIDKEATLTLYGFPMKKFLEMVEKGWVWKQAKKPDNRI